MNEFGNLPEYQQRVIVEKNELDLKIESLEKFINSQAFTSIDELHGDLLKSQLVCMCAYGNVLEKRILLFLNPITSK